MEASKTSVIATSLAIIFATLYYKQLNDKELRKHLNNTLLGLLRTEEEVPIHQQTKVAVGFGATADIFMDAIKVFDAINATAPEIPKHVEKIVTKEDLENIFGYFFQHGAAAE